MTVRWTGWSALLVLGLVAPALARRPDLPTAPLRATLDTQRAAGAERSEPLARALLYTAERAPADRRTALLRLAAQADPGIAAPHLALARRAARAGDIAGTLGALSDAVHAVRLDGREEARWLRHASRAAHGTFAATLATLALLLVLRAFRLVRHALGEHLGSYTAATLLFAVPILSSLAVSLALATLVMLVTAAPFMRRRERTCMAVLCLGLATLDFALPLAAPHAVLLDARTRAAAIARLNDGGPDAELETALAALPQRSAEAELVLGMQARRRGDLVAARAHYMACLHADSTCVPAYVDLANLFFRAGQYEHAAAGYRAAQSLAPDEPLPHYNLAQTYIRLLHYGESDGELRAAALHGMSTLAQRRALWRDETCPVLDMTLSKTALLRLARHEMVATPGLRASALQPWKSAPWQRVRPEVAPWLLLLAAALLLSRLRMRTVAVVCPGCGIVLCAHCASQAPADDLCNTCLLTRPRGAPRLAPTDDTPVAPPRRRVSLAAGRWVAPLFPGSADLARGAPVAACLTIAAAWAALLSCGAGVEAARLRGAPWFIWMDPALLRGTLLLFLVLWLAGLLRLRGRENAGRIVVRPAPPGV